LVPPGPVYTGHFIDPVKTQRLQAERQERINKYIDQANADITSVMSSANRPETFSDAMKNPQFARGYNNLRRAIGNKLYDQKDLHDMMAEQFPELRTGYYRNPALKPQTVEEKARGDIYKLVTDQPDRKAWTPNETSKFNSLVDLVNRFKDPKEVNPEWNVVSDWAAAQNKAPSERTPEDLRAINTGNQLFAAKRAPGVNVSFTTPQPGISPTGERVFFTFDRRSGKSNIVSGVTPPPNSVDISHLMYVDLYTNERRMSADSLIANVGAGRVSTAQAREFIKAGLLDYDQKAKDNVDRYLKGKEPGELPPPPGPTTGPNYRRKGEGKSMPTWLRDQYLQQAGGDVQKAAGWAREDGWTAPPRR
jgi:hypothetical protein